MIKQDSKEFISIYFFKDHLAFLQLSSGKSTLSDGNDEAILRQVLFQLVKHEKSLTLTIQLRTRKRDFS